MTFPTRHRWSFLTEQLINLQSLAKWRKAEDGWMDYELTRSQRASCRRGRCCSPERRMTGRRRSRWPTYRPADTAAGPLYLTDRPRRTHPPSFPDTPHCLQTHTHTNTVSSTETAFYFTHTHTQILWAQLKLQFTSHTHTHTHMLVFVVYGDSP